MSAAIEIFPYSFDNPVRGIVNAAVRMVIGDSSGCHSEPQNLTRLQAQSLNLNL